MTDTKRDKSPDSSLSREKSRIETDHQENGVSETRRKFTKGGLLAPPILMSVSSQPVFGALCLSKMLSGNLGSKPGPGNECSPGGSPAFYRDNVSQWAAWTNRVIEGDSIAGSRAAGGIIYPTHCGECQTLENPTEKFASCDMGTDFQATFPFAYGGFYAGTTRQMQMGEAKGVSMYEILCTNIEDIKSYFIAVVLNIHNQNVPNYAITLAQLEKVWVNGVGGYESVPRIKELLRRTWL